MSNKVAKSKYGRERERDGEWVNLSATPNLMTNVMTRHTMANISLSKSRKHH